MKRYFIVSYNYQAFDNKLNESTGQGNITINCIGFINKKETEKILQNL